MIILTGGAGFIGSNVLKELNVRGYDDIVIVDDIDDNPKWKNLIGLKFSDVIPIHSFYDSDEVLWKPKHHETRDVIIHLGAESSTMKLDFDYHIYQNTHLSKVLWYYCLENEIPIIYASSAAVYGQTDNFSEENQDLSPLNPYAISKWLFDRQVLASDKTPPSWYGLRFFNVYGENEQHKGQTASLIHQWLIAAHRFREIKIYQHEKREIKRDFVYVGDVARAVVNFAERAMSEHDDIESGIYNIGTGRAVSLDEVATTIGALITDEFNHDVEINHIDMPSSLIPRYQWLTEADMSKFRKTGMNIRFKGIKTGAKALLKHLKSTGQLI